MWSRVVNHTVVREMLQLGYGQLDERRIRWADGVVVTRRHRDRPRFVLEYGECVEKRQQCGS